MHSGALEAVRRAPRVAVPGRSRVGPRCELPPIIEAKYPTNSTTLQIPVLAVCTPFLMLVHWTASHRVVRVTAYLDHILEPIQCFTRLRSRAG